MTDLSHLDAEGVGLKAARGGLIRAAGYGAGLALSFAYIPLLIRHLGLAQFGLYSAGLAVVGISAGVVDFGLRDGATRELASAGHDFGQRFRNVALLRVAISLLGCALGVVLAAALNYRGEIIVGVAVAGAGQVINNLQSVLAVPLALDLRLKTTTLLDFSQQALAVLLALIALAAGLHLWAYFWVQGLAAVPILIVTAFLVRPHLNGPWQVDSRRLHSLLRTMLPFAAVTLLTTVYLRIAVLITSVESTALQTGYLGTSFRVIEALIYVPSVLVAALFPVMTRLADAQTERFRYAASETIRAMLVLGFAAGIAVFAGAPILARVLAGAHSTSIVPVLRIQALVLPSSFVIAVTSYLLLAQRRHRELVGSVALGLAVNAVLLSLLVSGAGAQGAATATAFGEFAIAVSSLGLCVRLGAASASVPTLAAVVLPAALALAVTVLHLPAGIDVASSMLVFSLLVVVCGAVPKGLRALTLGS